jgi:hypothetical protein
MKNFFSLLLVLISSLTFAVPAPQQITIELGESFSVRGADAATFEDMTFRLESVNMIGDNPQVMISLSMSETEEPETLLLEMPIASSIEVGDYTLTLLGADVPEDSSMSCAVSSATLVLEKTEAAM